MDFQAPDGGPRRDDASSPDAPPAPDTTTLGVLAGIALPAVLALAVRLVFGLHPDAGKVLSIVFVFALPLLMGLVTVLVGDRAGTWSRKRAFLMPLVPALLAIGIAWATGLEGAICIVMLLPLWFPFLGIGGLIGLEARRSAASRARAAARAAGRSTKVVCVALILPFVLGPIEETLPTPDDLRLVESSIDVRAGAEDVWAQIVRVPRIRPDELEPRFVHWMGFPRPLEATLSREGVGGVRHATFEGGVLFVETVDVFEPGRRLEFSIHADATTIPKETLDEHVTIGGPYFDVLRGAYRIEPIGPGRVRLHLSSRHRLSTRFNACAGLWTDFVMRSVQEEILAVVRARAERAAGS